MCQNNEKYCLIDIQQVTLKADICLNLFFAKCEIYLMIIYLNALTYYNTGCYSFRKMRKILQINLLPAPQLAIYKQVDYLQASGTYLAYYIYK